MALNKHNFTNDPDPAKEKFQHQKLWRKTLVRFDEVLKNDISLVGGKGANLGEMTKAGFPVPPGFCITVNAYRSFLETAGIKKSIFSKLDTLDTEDTAELDKVARSIRTSISNQKFPDDLRKEIVSAYKGLGKVAVRSSATAEDLPQASFAGQQDTYLNINGENKVIEAVQKCWASLFTARAIYYRQKNNFRHQDVLISVVVQQMIDPKYAGVMFTVDPVHKKYLLIEVVRGLGEQLVSGQVTPNTYFLDKKSAKVTEENIEFPFDKKILAPVAELGKQIERHYKKPQDIEFAIDKKGKFFILQSRPITTL